MNCPVADLLNKRLKCVRQRMFWFCIESIGRAILPFLARRLSSSCWRQLPLQLGLLRAPSKNLISRQFRPWSSLSKDRPRRFPRQKSWFQEVCRLRADPGAFRLLCWPGEVEEGLPVAPYYRDLCLPLPHCHSRFQLSCRTDPRFLAVIAALVASWKRTQTPGRSLIRFRRVRLRWK